MNGIKNGNGNLVRILVQGGLAGALILAMFIIWNLASNHLKHNTEALIILEQTSREEVKVLAELKSAIGDLRDELRYRRN